MIRRLLTLVIATALLAIPASARLHSAPQAVTLLGLDAGTSQTNITNFNTWLGKPAGFIVNFFNSTSRTAFNNDVPFELSQFHSYTNPIMWSFPLITSTAGETLANAASGSYDTSWTTALNEIIASRTNDVTIWLRVDWEMNGNFFPWYCTPDTTNYIASWQRFVGIARGLSSKFKFIWGPNQGQDNPVPCYPGDSYVDIVGIDAYYDINFDTSGAVATFGFFKTEANWGFNVMYAFGAAHGKPWSMPEWGVNTDTQGAIYINLMAAEFKSQNYYLQSYSDAIAEWTLSNNQFPTAGAAYIADFN